MSDTQKKHPEYLNRVPVNPIGNGTIMNNGSNSTTITPNMTNHKKDTSVYVFDKEKPVDNSTNMMKNAKPNPSPSVPDSYNVDVIGTMTDMAYSDGIYQNTDKTLAILEYLKQQRKESERQDAGYKQPDPVVNPQEKSTAKYLINDTNAIDNSYKGNIDSGDSTEADNYNVLNIKNAIHLNDSWKQKRTSASRYTYYS